MPSVIVLLAFLFSSALSADIYTWKDAGGVTHFSENKPAQVFKIITNDFHSHKTYDQGVEIPYNVDEFTLQTQSTENSGLKVQTNLIKKSQK